MITRLLDWDCASSPAAGETVCGDRAVMRLNGHRALAVAIDGLGHGPAAAAAAAAAADAASAAPWAPVTETARRCHAALRDTRGAALSIACFDGEAATLTWLGVGNVEGRLLRASGGPLATEELMSQPGVPGHDMPEPRATTHCVQRGDVMVLATDGIAAGFADALTPAGSCGDLAGRILAGWRRSADDALVLVARYLGERP